MLATKVDFEKDTKIHEINSALVEIIGDSAHEILMKLRKMNQEELAEFTNALLVIKKCLSFNTMEMEVWKQKENHEEYPHEQ
jgi:hypothetical protein